MDTNVIIGLAITLASIILGFAVFAIMSAVITSCTLKTVGITGTKHKVLVIIFTVFELTIITLFANTYFFAPIWTALKHFCNC